MNVICIVDDFQTSTSPSSFNQLRASSINRVDEILPMVYSFVHVRLTIGNPTRYVQISTPFIRPYFCTGSRKLAIRPLRLLLHYRPTSVELSWTDEWIFAINLTA